MSTTKLFNQLGLSSFLLSALESLGYELPTPIQEHSIPVLMAGEDLLAQAQTGTGKTAAFALPVLSHLDISLEKPQAIVIAPTRELAIQVAEAFQSYAKYLKGFHVAPIYGGQDYRIQLKSLKRGAHVIVGTPGRVMDHLRRGSLAMDALKMVILDEADEMLKMGFVDDIEWILGQIPHEHQTALFSATMPSSIQNITKRYLKNAKKIHIKTTTSTVDVIEQCYTCVKREQKLEALTRFLEVETIQAAIIFTRTKNGSTELAERLQARGYAAEALNGDMKQALRKKVVERIKSGAVDIVVATDVAARGLDIDRISHVINFDIPHDTESYIHRIGRTGRAGRTGKALLFVTPRERRLLNDIERATRTSIKQVAPPTVKEINEKRSKDLFEKVAGIIAKSKKLQPYLKVVENLVEYSDCNTKNVAAALVCLLQESNPLSTEEIRIAGSEFDRKCLKSRHTRGKSKKRTYSKKQYSDRAIRKSRRKR